MRSKLRVRHSRRQRATVLVEAIIVIASLTLLFMGLVFFRRLYVNTALLSRAARGSALYYAMVGCGDNDRAQTPSVWLGRDLGGNAADDPQRREESTEGASSDGSSSDANEIMSSPQVQNSNGVNPMTRVRIAGTTTTGVSGGVLSPDRTVFRKEQDAYSHVSCGDNPREGNVQEVLSYIWDMFGNG